VVPPRKTPVQVSGDKCPRTRLHPEVCAQEFRMKNDPYPLHIISAFVSLAIVVVWASTAHACRVSAEMALREETDGYSRRKGAW
jgi:hypothetical protein